MLVGCFVALERLVRPGGGGAATVAALATAMGHRPQSALEGARKRAGEVNGAAGGCSRRGEGRHMAERAGSKRGERQGAEDAEESAREGSHRPRVTSRGAAPGVGGRWRDR